MNHTALESDPSFERVYIWDLVVRWTHWLIFLSILVLSATGIYIGHPFFNVTGEARQHFFMGTVRTIHFYTAIVFTLAVLSRILWMFIGPRYARWNQFIPVQRKRLRDFGGTLKFYLFMRREPPPAEGHNPVAGAAYTLIFGLYLVEILTGLSLYSVSAPVGSPLRWFGVLLPVIGGPQWARWIHHVVMWLLLGFAVHHVYSGWLMTIVERTGTMDSIFSGYKWLHRPRGSEARRKEAA